MKCTNRMRAKAAILVAVLGWPLIEAVGGILMREHPPAQVVTLRFAAHLTLLLPFALVRSGTDVFRTRRLGLQLLRGFSLFLMPPVFIAGARMDGAAWMWSAFWTMVLLVLGGALLLGERPSRTAWIVAAVGVVGSWFARGSPSGGMASAMMGVASAACFGSYVVLSRILRKERLSTSLFYTALGALVPTLIMATAIWVPMEAADLVPALGLGVLSLLILGAIDRSLKWDALPSVAPWLMLVPAFEVALASGLKLGLPGARPLFGAVLILVTVSVWAVRSRAAYTDVSGLRNPSKRATTPTSFGAR